MGYIIAFVVLLLVIPGIFMLLKARSPRGDGTGPTTKDHGVTVLEPSSDQPTPGLETTNQPAAGTEQRLPPG